MLHIICVYMYACMYIHHLIIMVRLREEMRVAGETARIAKKWNVAWLRGTDWDALLAMEVYVCLYV